MKFVNIPEDRVGVLIGENGKVKKTIERKTKTKLTVSGNNVEIDGDSFGELKAQNVVLAIGRGFSSDKALLLLDDDYLFEILQLRDFVKTEKSMRSRKGRVIGREGKSRKRIENFTNCFVSVYGKTIAIIRKYDDLEHAKEAIVMLLTGSKHGYVYGFLEGRGHE